MLQKCSMSIGKNTHFLIKQASLPSLTRNKTKKHSRKIGTLMLTGENDMSFITTHHATERMQQRGISNLMLEALAIYGNELYQRDGATRLTFTKKGLENFKKDLQRLNAKAEKMRSLFAVENEGCLLTVGYQTKAIFK